MADCCLSLPLLPPLTRCDKTTLNIREADTSSPAPQLASVHPSSVNSAVAAIEWRSPFLAFHERVRTTKIYVRDCTPVPPLAVMIFGGGAVEQTSGKDYNDPYGGGGEAALCMDGWFTLNVAPASSAGVVLDLRRRVDALLAHMVEGTARHGGERGPWSHEDDAEKAALVGAIVALSRLEVLSPEARRRMFGAGSFGGARHHHQGRGGSGGVSKRKGKGGGSSRGSKGKGHRSGGSGSSSSHHPLLRARSAQGASKGKGAVRCPW